MTEPTDYVSALDRAGYRLTEPRRALAALIADQAGHFTAANGFYEAFDISISGNSFTIIGTGPLGGPTTSTTSTTTTTATTIAGTTNPGTTIAGTTIPGSTTPSNTVTSTSTVGTTVGLDE